MYSERTATKVEKMVEQLRLAVSEYPNQMTLGRIKFALSLAELLSTEIQMDEDATIPPITPPTIAGIDPVV